MCLPFHWMTDLVSRRRQRRWWRLSNLLPRVNNLRMAIQRRIKILEGSKGSTMGMHHSNRPRWVDTFFFLLWKNDRSLGLTKRFVIYYSIYRSIPKLNLSNPKAGYTPMVLSNLGVRRVKAIYGLCYKLLLYEIWMVNSSSFWTFGNSPSPLLLCRARKRIGTKFRKRPMVRWPDPFFT